MTRCTSCPDYRTSCSHCDPCKPSFLHCLPPDLLWQRMMPVPVHISLSSRRSPSTAPSNTLVSPADPPSAPARCGSYDAAAEFEDRPTVSSVRRSWAFARGESAELTRRFQASQLLAVVLQLRLGVFDSSRQVRQVMLDPVGVVKCNGGDGLAGAGGGRDEAGIAICKLEKSAAGRSRHWLEIHDAWSVLSVPPSLDAYSE